MREKKSMFSLPMLCAFAWFGHACGSSFATGRLAVQYCARHGVPGIIGGIIIYILTGIWMYITLEFGRLVKSKSYRDVVMGVYWDNKVDGNVMCVIWDLVQLFSIVVVSGSCISGSGSVLEDALGIDYTLGMVIFVIVLVILFITSPAVFKRLGKMAFPLFCLLMIVCVVSIGVGKDNLTALFAGNVDYVFPEGSGTYGDVMRDAFLYACTQLGFVGTGSIFAGQFTSRKDTMKAVGVGMVLCGGGLTICTIATLTIFPACIDITLPFLSIIKSLGGIGARVLYVAYIIALYVAYMSTAGSLVLSGVSRYGGILNKLIKNEKVTTAILVVVLLCASTIIGKLGLMTIVNKGYGMLGTLRMPTWYIPVLILGPISIRRVQKKITANKASESINE